MKQARFLIFVITIIFFSCNNNNEPDFEINIPINSVFVPVSIKIDMNNIDDREREEIINLVNNKHIVNDISELPKDPIGQNEAFYKINYNEHTLLIMYLYNIWPIETYSNRFYRNTKENSYNWSVTLGVDADYDVGMDNMQLARFAIIVRKLPVDADVQTWYSLTQIGLQPD